MLGSAAERESQLSLVTDLGYCNVEAVAQLGPALEEVMKLFRTYIARTLGGTE